MRCSRCTNCVGFYALDDREVTYYCIFDKEDKDEDECIYFESLYELPEELFAKNSG